jgi:hypothetical protein
VKDASEYLASIKALIVAHPQVVRWVIVREDAQDDQGLFRYRLTLRDGGLLEVFERFQVFEGRVEVSKYSFHWQDAGGQFVKRWDNAAHHPEVSTHPHHIHEGAEANVLAHEPMDAQKLLALIA